MRGRRGRAGGARGVLERLTGPRVRASNRPGMRGVRGIGLVVALALACASAVVADAASAGRKFVGVKACRVCHKAAKRGDQYTKWKKGPHSGAYDVLGTAKAKEVAAKAGVSGDPQKADECLECHVTGHGSPASAFGRKYRVEDGVGCESCHGAGSGYKKKSIMKVQKKAVAAGLVLPDEKLCKKCHNEKSPTFKPFDYEERLKEVSHPLPKKK
jgi:hypothetical protein